jgi:Zn finger protein HypA/HybF involved in hydrogenase expression
MNETVPAPVLHLEVVGGELRCQECRRAWSPSETARWPAFLTETQPPQIVLYCPDCAAREFEIARR